MECEESHPPVGGHAVPNLDHALWVPMNVLVPGASFLKFTPCSDLEGLRTTAVRSAYSVAEQAPDVNYLKSDVETRYRAIAFLQDYSPKEFWLRGLHFL